MHQKLAGGITTNKKENLMILIYIKYTIALNVYAIGCAASLSYNKL